MSKAAAEVIILTKQERSELEGLVRRRGTA